MCPLADSLGAFCAVVVGIENKSDELGMRHWVLLLIGVSISANANAAPDEAALAAFNTGAYEEAAALAVSAGGAENFALAARALNARAYFEDDRKIGRHLAERAVSHAEVAMQDDPGLPEAHMAAAVGEGLRAARMAPARAFLLNLPSRVRKRLDDALQLDDQNYLALATSAAWRMEVARRGGGKAYGASPAEGLAEFRRAREIAPANVFVGYECALRVLASGRAEWRPFALECLEAALAAAPLNAFDQDVQVRARALKAAILDGPAAEAAHIAAQT